MLSAILDILLKLVEKIPFLQVYGRRRDFDIQYAKQILSIFNYDKFNYFTDNIFNGYFYREEAQKMQALICLSEQKTFFNTKIKKELDSLINNLYDFSGWAQKEFMSECNSERIRLVKYYPQGQMIENYSQLIGKCSTYANELFEKYRKLYFRIQKTYPEAFT